MVRRIKVGDTFVIRDNIEVTVTQYKDTTCIGVIDSLGNTRTVNAQSLLTGRLQWRYKDGTIKRDAFTFDVLSQGEKPVRTRVKKSPMGDVHYVYIVTVVGLVVYVGQGKGLRMHHCLSGGSHNRHLNRLTFLKAPMIAEVVAEKLSKEEALDMESNLIQQFRPHCNIQGH